MSKVKGLIKSIIGTDAIVAVDANGNQRTLKAGDVIYDNEVIKEQDGVKVEVQASQTQNENASDETGKEIASLQEQLLNGKNISDLEETAAGGTQSTGGVSSNGVSLGAASFAQGGHYSNINANFENLSSQANASAEAFTNVSGGASEEGFSLDTLAAAIDNAYNNILSQPLEVYVTAVDDNVVTGNTDESVSHHIDIGDNILEHNVSERTGLHITNDNTPTLVGKATSNATISIFDGEGENAPLLGTTTTDNDGNWSYAPTSPLADGDHKFTIEASKVAANGEELKAISTQDITVDTNNNTLSITKISTDEFSDITYDGIEKEKDREYDLSPSIEGKAEPFADINLVITKAEVVYNDGLGKSWVEQGNEAHVVERLSARADADGNWRAESSVLDNSGTNKYTVQASSVDEAGNQYSEPQATTFYMPLEPTEIAPIDHL